MNIDRDISFGHTDKRGGRKRLDLFLVSYHAKSSASYLSFAEHIATRDALRLHRTLWVMPGPTKSWLSGQGSAASLRDALKAYIGEDDRLAVFELVDDNDWATHNALPGGVRRLKKHLGGGDRNATLKLASPAA
jgi:hypothetical protein